VSFGFNVRVEGMLTFSSDLLSKTTEEVSEIRRSQSCASGEVAKILELVEDTNFASRRLEQLYHGKELCCLHIYCTCKTEIFDRYSWPLERRPPKSTEYTSPTSKHLPLLLTSPRR
jgi:hypothetical protein